MFDNPPLKIPELEAIPQLNEVTTAVKTDDRVFVVFDSASDETAVD